MAKVKVKKDYLDKLAIWNLMSAIDRKDYGYYDSLNEEERKKISPYLLLRWGASVEGNDDISKYYALSINQNVNQEFWTLSKHPKLQWLMLCAASPNVGKQRHYWLGTAKGNKASKLKKKMLELLPDSKCECIDLLLKVSSEEAIFAWLMEQGLSDKN